MARGRPRLDSKTSDGLTLDVPGPAQSLPIHRAAHPERAANGAARALVQQHCTTMRPCRAATGRVWAPSSQQLLAVPLGCIGLPRSRRKSRPLSSQASQPTMVGVWMKCPDSQSTDPSSSPAAPQLVLAHVPVCT